MVLKSGEELESTITGIDRKSRVVSLSIKVKDAREEKQAIETYKSDADKPVAGATLGDLLKEQLTSD